MDLQDFVNPILHLELILGTQQEAQDDKGHRSNHFDETLEFNKSDEQILSSFRNYFDDMVECFNDFNRPEFCKIQEYGLEKYNVEMKELETSRKLHLEKQRDSRRARRTVSSQKDELQEAMRKGLFKQKNASSVIHPKMLNYDRLLYNKEFEASYFYEKYMGRIKVKEAPTEEISKNIVDGESQADIVF